MLTLNSNPNPKLNLLLDRVGDLNFRRRIVTMLDYLNVQNGDVILDMGCGEGFYSMLFDNLYDCRVIAVDNDQKILNMAQNWLKGSKKVQFQTGDITNLKFPDNYFDKIVCTEVLEHITDDKKAVAELYRVLKPGGILAVTVPNKNYPFLWDPLNKIREALGLGHFSALSGFWGGIWAYDHKRLYLPEELKKLLVDAHFEVEDLKVLTHYGVPFNHLVLYVGKNLYTKLPVPDEVKKSMEKFEWHSTEPVKKRNLAGVLMKTIINFGFKVLKSVDSLNEQEFKLTTSSMAVAIKATKK